MRKNNVKLKEPTDDSRINTTMTRSANVLLSAISKMTGRPITSLVDEALNMLIDLKEYQDMINTFLKMQKQIAKEQQSRKGA